MNDSNEVQHAELGHELTPPFKNGDRVRRKNRDIVQEFVVERCYRVVDNGRTRWVVDNETTLGRAWADDVELAPANSPESPDGSIDTTPVDESWLLSIGFSVRPDDHDYTLRIRVGGDDQWMRYLECGDSQNLPDTAWEIASYCEDGTSERAMIVDSLPTRDDVLMLLVALNPRKAGAV